MHLIVDPTRAFGVCIVSFWGKNKVLCKLQVAKERSDTKNDVAMMKLKVFASHNKSIGVEGRGATWQLVDDIV